MTRPPSHLRRAALLALGTAAAATLPAGAQERFTLEGDRVAVYNLAGEVRVEPGSGDGVVVEVTRGGSAGARLDVERGEHDGFRTLAVVYPGDEIVYPRMGRGSNTNLTVRGDGTFGGDSRIFGGGRRVTLRGAGRGAEAWADLRVMVPEGRTVAVHQAVGEVEVTNVRGDLRVKTASAAVRATGTRGTLNVDVGSGGVELEDAQGDLLVDTGSGGVRLSRVGGSRLVVDTGSGGVTGEGITVEDLRVDVGSGGVRLAGVAARDVLVDTGSGSVGLDLTRDARSVRIDTGSGGVTLGLPEDFGAELEIDTGSGGIDVDVPVTVRVSRRSHLVGTVGDGEGRVVIDTGSGGVRVRRSN